MDCIAEETFRCHPRVGEPFTLFARFGRPQTLQPLDGHKHPHGVCEFSFQPLVADRRSYGENQFQALCLAIEYLRTTLKVFVAAGGRIYWRDSDALVDLTSSWFGPFPSPKDFGGSWWNGESGGFLQKL